MNMLVPGSPFQKLVLPTMGPIPLFQSLNNLLFAYLINNGYSSSTLTKANDSTHYYWYGLLIFSFLNVATVKVVFPPILKNALAPPKQGEDPECVTDDGVPIECWEKAAQEAEAQR